MPITVSQNQEALRRVESYLSETAKPHVTYAPNGAVASAEEADGRQSVYTYSDWGDLIRIREANGDETRYEYQARRLTRVVFPDGGETCYEYDANGCLLSMSERGRVTRYAYNAQTNWTEAVYADGAATQFIYDDQGRVTQAIAVPPIATEAENQAEDRLGHRAGLCDLPVTTRYEYDEQGQTTAIFQEMNGGSLGVRLHFDASGRLSEMEFPGLSTSILYTWDEAGRPLAVSLAVPGTENESVCPLARFEFDNATRTTRVHLANGWVEETQADAIDCRPVSRRVCHKEWADETLIFRTNTYDTQGRIIADGAACYDYDTAGRLRAVHGIQDEESRTYTYDGSDRLLREQEKAEVISGSVFAASAPVYDVRGRQTQRTDERGIWTYTYDDSHNLRRVFLNGVQRAAFAYDHKGRLAAAQRGEHAERYVYGPADELLAVTDRESQPIHVFVRTPLGLLAQIDSSGRLLFTHCDDRGTCLALTDLQGDVIARYAFDPFGNADKETGRQGDRETQTSFVSSSEQEYTTEEKNTLSLSPCLLVSLSIFSGKPYFAEIGLYHWGARWYDPQSGRFLTRDTYTGAPDDIRLVHPCLPAGEQAKRRAHILMDWLKQPRVRRGHALCHGDPINHSDPDGHWALGGALLSLLGAVWSLPNTLLGLLLEITCLVGEVIRWLVFVMSGGTTTWQIPGVEGIVTSSCLNTVALVFNGGWIGSLPNMTALTFGSVIFVNKNWRSNPALNPTQDVKPPAYKGTVTLPHDQALYEREMRRGNQYGWFGPFTHLGVPTFGLYLWDLLINGPDKSWLANDAHQYGGV